MSGCFNSDVASEALTDKRVSRNAKA